MDYHHFVGNVHFMIMLFVNKNHILPSDDILNTIHVCGTGIEIIDSILKNPSAEFGGRIFI